MFKGAGRWVILSILLMAVPHLKENAAPMSQE